MADQLARVTATLYRNDGAGDPAARLPLVGAQVVAVPVLLDESVAIVDSRTRVAGVTDAAGVLRQASPAPAAGALPGLALAAGSWRWLLPDGETIEATVTAGQVVDLLTLRGYVPPPGSTLAALLVPTEVPEGWLLIKDGTGVDGLDPSALGGDQTLPTWGTISGKPAVVAEGATAADARAAIGAGTSSFSGAYADLSGKPTAYELRGLIITDTNVGTIPAGDAVDNLAAYYNSGASAITVQGTSIAAGAHAVWAWVSGAWVLLSSGTSEPAASLTAPTVVVDSATATSITVSYSTATTGVTGWQYRLDSGSPAALDGASPDIISGLTPSQSGTIEVRFTIDGTTWSPWGVASYLANSDKTFAPLRSYPYDSVTTISGSLATGVSATSTAATKLSTSHQAPVGTSGYGALVKVNSGGTGVHFLLSNTVTAGAGPANITTNISHELRAVAGKYCVLDPAYPSTVTVEAGDVLWAKYTGSAVEYSVSKDDGATWLSIASAPVSTTPTSPVAPYISFAGAAEIAWMKTHGMTRWGDVDNSESAVTLTLPSATGITNNGGGSYTFTNATGRGYATCDLAPKHISITITGLQAGVAGPRIWTSNNLTPGTAPSGDRNIVTIGTDHVLTIEQTTASEGMPAGPTNTGIVLADGDRITMTQRGATSQLWLDSRAQLRLLGTWPWWKTITIDTPGGVGVGTVAVKLGVSS